MMCIVALVRYTVPLLSIFALTVTGVKHLTADSAGIDVLSRSVDMLCRSRVTPVACLRLNVT